MSRDLDRVLDDAELAVTTIGRYVALCVGVSICIAGLLTLSPAILPLSLLGRRIRARRTESARAIESEKTTEAVA